MFVSMIEEALVTTSPDAIAQLHKHNDSTDIQTHDKLWQSTTLKRRGFTLPGNTVLWFSLAT